MPDGIDLDEFLRAVTRKLYGIPYSSLPVKVLPSGGIGSTEEATGLTPPSCFLPTIFKNVLPSGIIRTSPSGFWVHKPKV